MKRFFIIDAFALIYRSFFALNKNPRINSKGINTSAVLGFANSILDIITKYHPDMMAVAFESKSPTFRKEQFAEYKAGREAMPDELRASIPYIEQFLFAMRIAQISVEGFEADDVVGTLAKKAHKEGIEVYMVTPDKDYAQLVEDGIYILRLATGFSKEKIYSVQDVLDKYEVRSPKQIIDLLGLWGDSSDNIPGVKGIGEKKAKMLLQQFNSIEDILSHTDQIENKSVRKAIEENKEAALFSKELATIRLDVPLQFSAADYEIKKPDFIACEALFKELEFKKFSERFYKIFGLNTDKETGSVNITNTPQNKKSKLQETITENEELNLFSPIYNNVSKEENSSQNKTKKKPIVIDKKSPYYPILLAAYLLDPERKVDIEDLITNADTYKEEYLQRLKQDGLEKLYYDVELPLKDVLLDMEEQGLKVDVQALKDFSSELQKQKDQLQQEIWDLAGEEFNIASPKQLGEILFVKMDIAGTMKTKKTRTKQFSTAEEVLLKYKNVSPIVDKILSYREIAKLKNTYVDALPEYIDPVSQKIHTCFNQTVTATGRLSSSNPNLQNIPIRTELGKHIRKAFTASDENHLLLSADYSQIELRIIASLSGDEHLCNEFTLGHDIHRSTAAKIYGVSQDEVTKQMRSAAKSVNFGIIYGISAFGLSQGLGISRREAQELIDQYFEQFPKIKEFIDDRIEFARKNGFAQTLMGRRRYLRNINGRNSSMRAFDERNAVNMTIQGTGADMIKMAMVSMYNVLKKENLKSKMILQIHDELVFDVPKEELDAMRSLVKITMENALPLPNVPILTEIGWGNNWLEIH